MRDLLQVLPPQPTLRTEKDIGSEGAVKKLLFYFMEEIYERTSDIVFGVTYLNIFDGILYNLFLRFF